MITLGFQPVFCLFGMMIPVGFRFVFCVFGVMIPVGFSAQCPVDWDDDSGDVPILFVVPMFGDALHVDWW